MKKKVFSKKIIGISVVLLAISILVLISILLKSSKTNNSIGVSPENLRAMNYEQFQDGDDVVYKDGTQGTDNEEIVDSIKFSSFFLRDLDGDGYAEKLKGTCKRIRREDTLYIEIIVQTEGYLKNGKIEIDGKNFCLQTNLPKDDELKNNYMGSDIKTIEFENLYSGTQKLMTGKVRTGNYTFNSMATECLGKNINNYSRMDNKIVLTGIYVDDSGNEVPVRKEINLAVDWYGTVNARINQYIQDEYNLLDSFDEENNKLVLDFYVNAIETNEELFLGYNYTEGTIPNLNGYAPISVSMKSGGGEFTYDEVTGKFIITKEAFTEDNGDLVSSIASNLYYGIQVVYPLEAYSVASNDEVSIEIPVKTFFKGFNNPNDEFQNPYVSNLASAIIKVSYKKPKLTQDDIHIMVGGYSKTINSLNNISKKKPLRIYNGTSSEEIEDYYTVKWIISTGTNEEYNKIVLKENIDGDSSNVDTFIKNDSTEESMENVASYAGIYFSNIEYFLKDNGEIKIYDESTGNLLVTFTTNGINGSKKWSDYGVSNPYYYDTPVKHIRIETSDTKAQSELSVYNVKELDDESITTIYNMDEFDDFKYIKSNLVAYANDRLLDIKSGSSVYKDPYSDARIYTSKNVLSTQVTEKNFKIEIRTFKSEEKSQEGWVDSIHLIKIPDEIALIEINSITINNSRVTILSSEIIEKDDHKFIKVKTSSDEPLDYTIMLDTNITPDPRILTVSKNFELYSMNSEARYYRNGVSDLYDTDNDGNVTEIVNYDTSLISMISPNSLLTNQTISEFDGTGTIIISPQIADLKPIYSEDDREKQTVKIGIQMRNNYSSTISETKILGKIPFEGNDYVVSGIELNSEFTTTMRPYRNIDGSLAGIEVPEELKDKVTVYYSENEKTNRDLTDEGNGWTICEDVDDWSKIKTYLIDFEDTVINIGAEYTFYYVAEIPFGVEFNKVSYSHHGIYFSLDTPEGKYRTSTEPNKIGIRIADKYNLKLKKYQSGKENNIEGATYKVSKLLDEGGIESSQTAVTNSEGELEMANLYAEKKYEITEISTPENYELNEDVIGIVGHIDRITGTLTIEKLYGETKDNITVQKNDGEDYKIVVNVEDEARASLKIIKTDKNTNLPIKGTKFKILGNGFNTSGKIITTNISGEATIKGIKIGEIYTLEETKAEGYYLASPISFRIVNSSGVYELEFIDGEVSSSTITLENNLPILNLEIENEAIPKYNLEITKIKHITEVEGGNGGNNNEEIIYLQGAKFKLYKDGKELGTYITDENGKLTIENLYQFEENRNINQTYTLREVLAPEGYTKVKDIVFRVSNNLGTLEYEEELEEGQSEKKYIVEGNTVKLTVEDSPIFKLIKKDVETGEPLSNTKFSIYDISLNGAPARNSRGEIVGQREIIDGREYYTVTTNSEGEISIDLPEGLYKAKEVLAPDEKYDLDGKEYYFGIASSIESPKAIIGKEVLAIDHSESLVGIDAYSADTIYFHKVVRNQNDEYIVLGDYTTPKGTADLHSFIAKFDSEYQMEWINKIEDYGYSSPYDMILLKDDGFVVDYYDGNSRRIGKYTSEGNNAWSITIDSQCCMSATADGGFLVGLGNGKIKKYNSSGNLVWERSINYTGSYNIGSLIETKDGGFIVGYNYNGSITDTERTFSANGNNDILIIKYNSSREFEWGINAGGSSADNLKKIIQNSIGDYIISADLSGEVVIGENTYVTSVNNESFIIKISENGDIRLVKQLGSSNSINNLVELSDGKILLSGINSKEGIVLKLNKNLEIEALGAFKGSNSNNICSIFELERGKYLACGTSYYTMSYTYRSTGKMVEYTEEEYPTILGNWVEKTEDTQTSNLTTIELSDGGKIELSRFSGKKNEGYTSLNSIGGTDIEIVKYDKTNNVEWAINVGSTDNDSLPSIAEIGENNYLLTGVFSGETIGIGNQLQGYKYINNYSNTMNLKIVESHGTIDTTEMHISNDRKQFNITTDIKEIDNVKGGTISGEDCIPYEIVKYGDSNLKEIKVTPNEGYEIINITVNGQYISFEANSDGSYTMPQFDNITENKYIVATFAQKNNKIILDKIDSKTAERIEEAGVSLKLDQIEEREEPLHEDVFGELVDNGQTYYYANMDNEVLGTFGEMTDNGTSYFVEEDGKYVPTNSTTYQLANGGTSGIAGTANSYIPIDLTGLDGSYKIVVNASVSSRNGYDYGYAIINQSTTAPTYSNSTGRFVYITGTQASKDYESSTVLEGGKTYYLHLGYYKRATTYAGTDQFIVNSVNLYNTEGIEYNFSKTDDNKYESTNQGKDSTECNSYIPINLENYEGKYNLTVNAEISSQRSYDYGYVTITENTNRPNYNSSTGRIVNISGTQEAKDYGTVLEGGKNYYLHMGYYKNASTNTGLDKFTINSITLSLNNSDLFHRTVETNAAGQAITQIPFGKYAITELKAPEGYILDEIPTVIEFRDGGTHEFTIENDKKCNVIVHHYLKGTTEKVVEDDILQGKEGKIYNSTPKIDILNYEPEKDEYDNYVIPDNYTGEYTYEDKEVIYYYTQRGTLLTVNHYIEGTETKVPLKNGNLAETEYIVGNKGTNYETHSLSAEELSDYYVYSYVDGETSGIYGDNEIIVTYYYKKAHNSITINKFGEDGETLLEGAKFSVTDVNDNIVQLSEMTSSGTYFFEKQGNKYISNNQNVGSTVANSYMKIDMTYAKKDAKVIVNAEISSQRNYDYGYATLTESTEIPTYNNSLGRFICISGTVGAADYEAKLQKGKVYYLHLGYRKNASTNTGTDAFTVNSIRIEGAKLSKTFTTNSTGKIEEEIDTGEYEIREIKAPYGYNISDNAVQRVYISNQVGATVNVINERKIGRVIVHHYIEGTEIPLAEDEIIEKKVFETYETNDVGNTLEKYSLIADPTNKTGIVREEDTVVTYYYRRDTGNLKLNKVDLDTNEAISGVRFGVYEGDYGSVTLEDATKVGNIYTKLEADKTDESDVIPELSVPSNWTGFEEIGGKYIPVNSTWYVKNQDDAYEGDNWANANVNIDLRTKEEDEYFVLTTDVEMRNTENYDTVYAWFNDGYINGNWIYLSGEKNENYEVVLQGGRSYQLGIEYYKSSSTTVEDYVSIEMKVFNAENVRANIINDVSYYLTGGAITEEVSIEKEHYTETNYGLPFAENNGTYVATTCQKYMNDNNIDPSNNWTNHSYEYVVVDLTDQNGYFDVSVNLLMQNTSSNDYMYLWVQNAYDLNEGKYLETENGIMADGLWGEHNEKYHTILEGGKKYYLYFGYEKNSDLSIEDYVEVSDIKLYKANIEKVYMGFDKTSDGKYVSNIQGQNNATAHSVIPIDLRDKEETVELTVNAEISSEEWNDYGRIIVTDVFNLNDYAVYWYELISMSGEVEAQDYKLELEGGKIYYLHMLYEKNWSDNNTGNDTFTINSVRVETPIYDTIITNEEGTAEITLPTNDYTIVELAPKEGYDPIEPQKATLTKDGLDLTIRNERSKGNVVVNHFIEGTEENITDYDGEEIEPELKKGVYGETFETEAISNLSEKYELVESPIEPDGVFSEESQTKTYYYRIKKYPYVVNYLLKDNDDDDANNEVIASQKAEVETYDYGTIINTDDEIIQIGGYTFDSANKDSLKITGSNNIINIYYVKGNFNYTVEYYYDGVKDVDKTETSVAEYQSTISMYVDKNITGYKLSNTENVPLTITENVDNNVIKVFYVKDNFDYTVEYYYDGVKDNDKTEVISATYQDKITTYTDKNITGYKLSRTEGIPLTISENSANNIIKVYYVEDKKNYTVEYYYDGVKDNSKTEIIQTIYPSIITAYVDKNIAGYKLDKTEGLPLEITENSDNNVIKVYYVKDNFNYTVEYYYDGVKDNDKTETISAAYKDEITTYTDKNITGYKLGSIENLPLTITENADNNVIKVYYVKDNFSYTVEYYYDGIKDEDKTEVLTAQYQDEIATYPDKSIEGYILNEEKNLPLRITENPEDNVIKVYYTVDEESTKKLKYTVEYYKDNELVEEDVTEKTKIVQILSPTTMEFDKSLIDNDKYTGYEIDYSDPEIIPDVVNNGDTFKIYYKKKHFPYMVKYYYQEIEDEELTEEGEAEYGSIIVDYEDKAKYGYRLKGEVKPLQITDNANENIMNVYYEIDESKTKELHYKVKYFKDGEEVALDMLDKSDIVQVLQPDKIVVDKTEINITDKYEKHVLDRIEVNDSKVDAIPEEVNNNDEIKVYYKLKTSQIRIKYVDENGNVVKVDYIIDGNIDEKFDLSKVNDIVDGYELKSKSREGITTFEDEPIEITYVYRKANNVKETSTITTVPSSNQTSVNNTTVSNQEQTKVTTTTTTSQTVQTQTQTQTQKQTEKPTSTAKTENNKEVAVQEDKTPALGDEKYDAMYIIIMIVLANTVIVYIEFSKKR